MEKLTELGASSITYAICDRTIAAPTDARLSRWRRLAVSAAKQSLRRDIPTVHTAHFEAVVAEVRAHAAALVFVSGGVHVLDQDVVSRVEDADGALLVVGPEGGFSDQEIDSLIVAGGLCVGLGGGRLRVETAVVTAAAVVAMILATIET